jgi:hypothetical protein
VHQARGVGKLIVVLACTYYTSGFGITHSVERSGSRGLSAAHFVNDAVAMTLPLAAPPQRAGRIHLPDNPVYHGRQRLSPVMLPIMPQAACKAS